MKLYISFFLLSFLISVNLFSQQIVKVFITDIVSAELISKMQVNTSRLLTEINIAFVENKIPKLSDSIITKEALKSIIYLWKNSSFYCYKSDINEKGLSWEVGCFEVRNIPLFIKDADSTNKYQEATIIFNSVGLISDFKMSIKPNQYNELLKEGESNNDIKRRRIIINFIENYLTSYNRKDIDFINTVYNGNGLIISKNGVKENQKNSIDNLLNLEKKEDKIMQPKLGYISGLKRVMKYIPYFNINFDEIEIIQHHKYPEIYGVTLKQDWYSSNYNDVGYLFLIIDFTNEEEAIIHVQTWQPEKVNNEVIKKEDIFSLGAFDIVK